jgi:hypothetical protein
MLKGYLLIYLSSSSQIGHTASTICRHLPFATYWACTIEKPISFSSDPPPCCSWSASFSLEGYSGSASIALNQMSTFLFSHSKAYLYQYEDMDTFLLLCEGTLKQFLVYILVAHAQ